jgi:hypothetical protein
MKFLNGLMITFGHNFWIYCKPLNEENFKSILHNLELN